jgi:PAS domain-containing protein
VSKRRWCKALSGLWERRESPAVRQIVGEVLAEAEGLVGADTVWFGRFLPCLRILEMNGPALGYLGLEPADCVGHSLGEFINEDSFHRLRTAAEEAMLTGRTAQAFVFDRNGKPMVVHTRATRRQGQAQVLLFAHYARQRLFQMPEPQLIGDPA